MPFLYGPRQWIGNGFAMMEAQLILTTIRQRVQLRLQPGQGVRMDPLITLSPAGAVMMDVEARLSTLVPSE